MACFTLEKVNGEEWQISCSHLLMHIMDFKKKKETIERNYSNNTDGLVLRRKEKGRIWDISYHVQDHRFNPQFLVQYQRFQ